MKTDNALRKALKKQAPGPTYGFSDKLMRQIMLESERSSRRSYYRSLAMVSVVSLFIVAGSFAAMEYFLKFRILDFLNKLITPFSELNLSNKWSGQLFILQYSVFIAVIALLLLALDHFLRKRFGKL